MEAALRMAYSVVNGIEPPDLLMQYQPVRAGTGEGICGILAAAMCVPRLLMRHQGRTADCNRSCG